ncbi:MAG: hypothetical protein ABI443_11995 [Chthoniobacterales bacterium]
MRRCFKSGMTVIEIIVGGFVCLVSIVILVGLAFPGGGLMPQGQALQTLSNMRQIQQLAFSAAEDRKVSGDTNLIGWPGDNNFAVWVRSLTNSSITGNVVAKLFSAPGVELHELPQYKPGKTAVRVYQVSEKSATNTVFLSSYNWNAETPNAPLSRTSLRFGNALFVILHKDGEGKVYKGNQATNTNTGFFGVLTNNIRP